MPGTTRVRQRRASRATHSATIVNMVSSLRAMSTAVVGPVVAFTLIAAGWWLFEWLADPNPLILPAPGAVWSATWENFGPLMSAVGVTLWAALWGFAVSVVAGLVLAIVIVRFANFAKILWPALTVLNAAPKVVAAPILVIWFGIGFQSKVSLAFLLGFFPVVINCVRGLSEVSPELLEYWRLMRATPRRILWKVRLPHCLPFLFDGCLIALPIAMVGAVIAEFVSGAGGIGNQIIIAYSQFNTPLVFAATILISVVSTFVFLLLRSLEPWLIPWGVKGR